MTIRHEPAPANRPVRRRHDGLAAAVAWPGKSALALVLVMMLLGSLPSTPQAAANPLVPTAPRPGVTDSTTVAKPTTVTKPAKLITLTDETTGLLAAAPHAGVHRVAFVTPALTTVSATVNGKAVRVPAESANHERALLVSRTDGVKRGVNRLRITATAPDGGTDVLVRRFQVKSVGPMAAAGPNQSVTAGSTLRVSAKSSVPGQGGRRLRYQWRVVQSPAGTSPALRQSRAVSASMPLTTPGRYVLAVTVTERHHRGPVRKSTDLISVDAALPTPALGARIDTMANDPAGTGAVGLLVDATFPGGGQTRGTKNFYPGPAAGNAMVYTLDRTTLRPSAAFDGRLDPADPDASLGAILTDLPAQILVVVVGSDGCCAKSDGKLLPTSGPFSHIFNYDGAGTANVANAGTWNKNLQIGMGSAGRPGGLTGYLRLAEAGSGGEGDGSDAFRFVQGDRMSFNTNTVDEALLGPADGATYRIMAGSHGALQPRDDATEALTRIVASNGLSTSQGQQWQLRRTYGQYFQLVNVRSGQCLNWNLTDYLSAILFPCVSVPNTPALNELWLPKSVTFNGKNFWEFRTAQTAAGPAASPGTYALTWTSDGLTVKPRDTVNHEGQDFTFAVAPGTYTVAATGGDVPAGQVLAEPKIGNPGGTALTMQARADMSTQRWRLLDADGGSFTVVNQASGLCMDLAGGSTSSGAVVLQQGCDPSKASQRWQVSADANGLLVSPAGAPDRVLGRQGKTSVVINDDEFTGQRWRLQHERTTLTMGGTYAMTSVSFPGTALAPAGTTNVITGGPIDDGAAQHWLVQDAKDGLVQLVNSGTRQCLVRYLPNGANQTLLLQATCAEASQYETTWKLDADPDGSYAIVQPGAPNAVLTQATGGSVTMAADTDGAGQRWLLSAAQTTMQVGLHRYSTAIAHGASGFTVLALDASLRPVTGLVTVGTEEVNVPTMPAAFVTNGSGGVIADHDAVALGRLLRGLAERPGTMVLLQSTGHPRPTSAAWNDIAEGVKGLGGDGSQVLQLDGTGGYTLAGCSGCVQQPQFNESLRHQVDSRVLGARLAGVLTRNASSSWQANGGTSVNLDSTFGDLAAIENNAWPYDDGGMGTKALAYIEGRLNLPTDSTCRAGRALSPIRRNYCPAQGNTDETIWSTRLTTLTGLTFPTNQTNFSEGVFNSVVTQLEEEFADLTTVGSMMGGLADAYSPSGAAQGTAETIAGVIRDTLPTPNNHGVLGGVLSMVQESLSVLMSLAPLVAADEPTANGVGEDFHPAELVESLLGLVGASLELGGDNDDGSAVVSDKLTTDATNYATALDNQLALIRTNMSGVESVIVSDPVKLALTADNVNESWNLGNGGAAQLKANLANGAARDLWTKMTPTDLELWTFPPIPTGLKITDTATIDQRNKSVANNYLYSAQPVTAYTVTSVDENGVKSFFSITVVTPVNTRSIQNNVNRVVSKDIMDRLTRTPGVDGAKKPNAGFAAAELPYELDFDRFAPPIWPQLMNGNYGLQLRNSTTRKIWPFCDPNRPFSACPPR